MNFILKTKGNQPIDEKDKQWAEAKFRKLAKLCPPASVIEVTLEDLYGPKGGQDKCVHVLAELPGDKQPFHLTETDLNFRKAITTARDRFERHLKRLRERSLDTRRKPRKYWLADLAERIFRRRDQADEE